MLLTVLDFESAYGKHPETGEAITLSKMTTEEYVRHPLFKVHGLGVKIGAESTFYIYTLDDLLHFLKTHPWGSSYVVAHHTHFDGAILSWRLGIRPAFWGCTLSMARAVLPYEDHSLDNLVRILGIGEKGKELVTFQDKWALTDQEQRVMGNYCINDVDLTYALFNRLKAQFPVSELRLIDWTIRCFTEPVFNVDPVPLIEEFKYEKRTKRALMKACGVDNTILASNDKFAKLLFSLGINPPKKLSPSKVKDGRVKPTEAGEPPYGLLPIMRVQKGMTVEQRAALKEEKRLYPWAYAFGKQDEEFLLLKDHPNKHISLLVDARLGVKSTIKETRSKRFYKIGKRGTFPVYLNYAGAHTLRWCLVGNTEILVERNGVALLDRLDALLPADRVWDGESFVTHSGLVCRGRQSVITWDHITGTSGHRVFVGGEVTTLGMAKKKELRIDRAVPPDVDIYRVINDGVWDVMRPSNYDAVEEVYDILNCGPNNRFVANGKLVHNSGGDKQNAQNLTRVNPKDPKSGALRRSLLAPPGHVVCVRDQSQIEARVLAYLAGQDDLLDVFRQGGDPYNRQATAIFGYEVDRKSPEHFIEGLAGKASVLGNGYSMGWLKFQESLRVGFLGAPPLIFDREAAQKMGADIDVFCLSRSYKKEYATLMEEALAMKPLNMSEDAHLWHCAAVKQVVDKYRQSNDAIVRLWKEAGHALEYIIHGEEVIVGQHNMVTTDREGLVLPSGMKIRYYKLKKNSKGEYRYLSNRRRKEWAYIYGGKCVENIVQALARIILSDQLLMAKPEIEAFELRPGEVAKIASSTHDELIAVVPERYEHQCQTIMERAMATAPSWCPGIPLKSGGGSAVNYGACEK